MRTTVDLDEDVLLAIKERARREHRSAGRVLSELARQGLMGGQAASSDRDVRVHHGFVPLPRRGGVVTNHLVDQLREDEPA